MQKKTRIRNKRLYAILSVVMAALLIAALAVEVYSSAQTKIFETVEYGLSQKNSQVYVSDKLGLIYLGTYENNVIAFDKDGNQKWTQTQGGAVGALDYEEENDWLIVGSQDRNVYVYTAMDGQLVNTLTVSGKVQDMAYNPESHELIVSANVKSNKHFMHIFDLMTGEEKLKMQLTKAVRAADFTADGQYMIMGDNRQYVSICSKEDGKTIVEQKMKGEVQGVAAIAATGEIVAFDASGYLAKYDKDLNLVKSVKLVGEGRCASVSRDGRWVAVGTREGDVYILNSDLETQFHILEKDNYDISQVYFGESQCFAVTLSNRLYEFSESRLDNINFMTTLKDVFLWLTIAFAVLTCAMLIAAFDASSAVAGRFFRSMYKHRTAYLMLLPSITLILIFNYYNVFQAFYYAFTDWSKNSRTMREVQFIGLDNFKKMLSEGYFLMGVKNLIILILASFVKLLTVPLFLAELVFVMRTRTGESSKRRYWFRLLLVVPMVVPGVVSALMWKNIYDPNIGALNSILEVLGHPELRHSWLGDENTALGAIIFMGFPWVHSFAFLVFYGGLINIPEDLFEAAKVDGATPLWNLTHLHLPLITPQIKMLIITTFISSVQDYGGIFLLTQGGPGYATWVPGLELYYAATKFGQYGYACAMGVVMFVVILIGSMFNLRMKTQELV